MADGQSNRSESLASMAVELTIIHMAACSDSSRRSACMQLDSPVFEELCKRLLDRKITVRATAEWLGKTVKNAPTKSSVERFSTVLFREFKSVAARLIVTMEIVRGEP